MKDDDDQEDAPVAVSDVQVEDSMGINNNENAAADVVKLHDVED